jgi:hypothetical protein
VVDVAPTELKIVMTMLFYKHCAPTEQGDTPDGIFNCGAGDMLNDIFRLTQIVS